MALIEVKVPDIGDFAEVAVIELLVKPGDTVTAEQSLITVESDKASMEIPSSAAGVVKELKVKIGDKVAMGSVVLMMEATDAGVAAPSAAPAAAPVPSKASASSAPAAASYAGGADIECDMLVLGAGPGGYSGAFRAAPRTTRCACDARRSLRRGPVERCRRRHGASHGRAARHAAPARPGPTRRNEALPSAPPRRQAAWRRPSDSGARLPRCRHA